MTLGVKLRMLRARTKRTMEELSKVLGVSLNTVYRWENDISMVRRPKLHAIAAYYGVSIDWLLTNESEEISSLEKEMLGLFSSLSETTQHRAFGYIERLYAEEAEQTNRHKGVYVNA